MYTVNEPCVLNSWVKELHWTGEKKKQLWSGTYMQIYMYHQRPYDSRRWLKLQAPSYRQGREKMVDVSVDVCCLDENRWNMYSVSKSSQRFWNRLTVFSLSVVKREQSQDWIWMMNFGRKTSWCWTALNSGHQWGHWHGTNQKEHKPAIETYMWSLVTIAVLSKC